jgi:NaMN:DMB phosphoribosyltransferase
MTAGPADPSAPPEDDVLEALGRAGAPPGQEAADDVRERFAARTAHELGRLAALAVWWAEVRDDAAAPPPARAVFLGADDSVPVPSGGTTRRALDPPDDVDAAVAWGRDLADALADAGTDVAFLVTPGGVTGRALAGYLMGLDPVETNGWPIGPQPDDDRWMAEVEVVRDTLWRLRGLRGRPVAMLRVLGDARVAASAAFLVQSAARRTPVVLDGPGAAVAALLAARCNRVGQQWWQAAEQGDVPLHQRTLRSLGLVPLTRLDLHVEDGTASAVAFALVGVAAGLLARG